MSEAPPAKSRPHVFLVGPMGAGKSTVGHLLAERLGRGFVDLDALVEEREGRTVPEIWAVGGEDAFRTAEREALASLSPEEPLVVGCGGGVVTDAGSRGQMARQGAIVYLRVSPEEAARRIDDVSRRPLLTTDDPLAVLRGLMSLRARTYEDSASISVDTEGRTPEQVTEEVMSALNDPARTSTAPTGAAVPVLAIEVRAPGGAYEVEVGSGILGEAGARLRARTQARNVALVTDENVHALFGERVTNGLRAAGMGVVPLVVPAGEASKSWTRAGELLERMAAAGLERGDALVALGGGVVGDLGGFCASVYLRGIPFLQVPTTLLAQVDAAIGGKTAVDLDAGKNLAGTFWQPLAVVADVDTLPTLPEREWRSGLAEVAKTALLAGADTLALVEEEAEALLTREPAAIRRVVAACAAVKARVVSADERESGERASLNYGHTFGHALEKAAGFGTLSHGEAVAEGMRFAARLAEEGAGIPSDLCRRQDALLDRLGLPPLRLDLDADAVMRAMASDKKVRDGVVRFVVIDGPGHWSLEPVAEASLERSVRAWAGEAALRPQGEGSGS